MPDNKDLMEFQSALLTGVTVGVGSQILVFDNGVTILIQCSYEFQWQGVIVVGHGEDVTAVTILFSLLNHRVMNVFMGDDGIMTLEFEDTMHLKILPERNGLESYVVTTRFGICPVILG